MVPLSKYEPVHTMYLKYLKRKRCQPFLPQVYSGCAHLSVSDPATERTALFYLCEGSEHRWAQ